MHVCVVFGLTLSPPGGAERLALEEVRAFRAAGYDVTVVAAEADREYVRSVVGDCPVVTVGHPRVGWRGVRLAPLVSTLRRVAPDLVVAHYAEAECHTALRSLRRDTPVVHHVHGSALWFPNNPRILPHRRNPRYDELLDAVAGHREFHGEWDVSVRRRLYEEAREFARGRALRATPACFTGSERVADELRALYDADPVVIRPGIDATWRDRADETDPVDLPYERTILSVSRLDPRKRIDLLVESLAELHENGETDVGLVVGGTGPDEQRLRALVNRRGLGEAVTFAGYIQETDLPTYYRSADVFACAAWMTYGLAPLEAYAMGTPVALSTDTFVHELVGDSPAVAVTPPDAAQWADSLSGLLDTDETPDPSVVPTWEEFTDRKLDVLQQRGVL